MDEYGFRGLPQIHFAWLKYTTLWRIGHQHFHKDRTTCLMERGIVMYARHIIVPLVHCFKFVSTSNETSGSSLSNITQSPNQRGLLYTGTIPLCNSTEQTPISSIV